MAAVAAVATSRLGLVLWAWLLLAGSLNCSAKLQPSCSSPSVGAADRFTEASQTAAAQVALADLRFGIGGMLAFTLDWVLWHDL